MMSSIAQAWISVSGGVSARATGAVSAVAASIAAAMSRRLCFIGPLHWIWPARWFRARALA